MHRVQIDSAGPGIKKFIRDLLGQAPDGAELVLGGEVVGTLLPPMALSDAQREEALARGWELVRKAQQRSKGVPARLIEREVRDAVAAVRRRPRQR